MLDHEAVCHDCNGRGEVGALIWSPCCSGWLCGCQGQYLPEEILRPCPGRCPLPGEPAEAAPDPFYW